MSDADYRHPDSGRLYRQGDPAHRFAVLVSGLRRQCEEFLHHYDGRMADRDYLDQFRTWSSDPERISRAMRKTLDAIDSAQTEVVCDRDLHEYGLGVKDVEWHRKYGPVGAPTDE